MPGVIYDQNGNIVGSVKSIDRFIVNKLGEIINPSTDDLLNDIKSKLQYIIDNEIPTLSKDITLQSIRNKLETGLNVSFNTPQQVNVIQTILPPDAAKDSTLSAINSKIQTTTLGIKVDSSHYVQPVSISSLPLPDGAAKDVTLKDGSQVSKILDSNGNIITASSGALNVIVKDIQTNLDLNYNDDEVRIYGSSNVPIKTNAEGNIEAIIIQSVLPPNAATETTLSQINSKIQGNLAQENGNLKTAADTLLEINDKIDVLAKQSTLSNIENKLLYGILKVDPSEYTLNVVVNQSALPTGAATEFKQDLIYSKLNNIEQSVATEYTLAQINQKLNVVNNAIRVDASAATISANVLSLPLPPGAAKDSTLTNGSQVTKILDSSGNVINSTSGSLNVYVTGDVPITASQDSIRIFGTYGTQAIAIAVDENGRLLLPYDAAQASKQDTANSYLNQINNKVQNLSFTTDGKLKVDAAISIAPEIEVKNDAGNPVPVNIISIPLPPDAAQASKQDTANTFLSQINSKIATEQVLGFTKNRPDYTAYKTGISGWDLLAYGPYNLASGASTTINIVVPSNEKWHINSLSAKRDLVGGAGRTSSLFHFIWDPNGENKTISYITADGSSDSTLNLCYSVVGNGGKVLRVVITNGNAGTSNHYFIISVYREVLL